jgi:hypothetical protein
MSLWEAPVFRPTWEEFQDFNAFIERIEPLCAEVGLCKVIPPPEWNGFTDVEDAGQVLINPPIRQSCSVRHGVCLSLWGGVCVTKVSPNIL